MKTIFLELDHDQLSRATLIANGEKRLERWVYTTVRKEAGKLTEAIDKLRIRKELVQPIATRMVIGEERELPTTEYNDFVHTPQELEDYKTEVTPRSTAWTPSEGGTVVSVRVPDEVFTLLWESVAFNNLWNSCLNENNPSGGRNAAPVYATFEKWVASTIIDSLVSHAGTQHSKASYVEEDELYPGLSDELSPKPSDAKPSKKERKRERTQHRFLLPRKGVREPVDDPTTP